MKKLLSIAASLLLCAGVQAQIVSSRSSIVKSEKTPSNTQWVLRGGPSFMNMSAEGAKMNVGYDVSLGFQKPIRTAGAYWGMDFGLTSRGCKADDVKMIAHGVQYTPFTFGWKAPVADGIRIDPHVGVSISYDFSSKVKADGESCSWSDLADELGVDCNKVDLGMNLGVGVWMGRFNVDLTYHHGFVDAFADAGGFKANNVMLRVGVAF